MPLLLLLPEGSAARVATGCCTELWLNMLCSLLLVLTRLQLPSLVLLLLVCCRSGVLDDDDGGASLLKRLEGFGGGVLKLLPLSTAAAAAAGLLLGLLLGLFPGLLLLPRPSPLLLRSDIAAADLAEGLLLLSMLLRRLRDAPPAADDDEVVCLPVLWWSGRSLTSPLRLRELGPLTGSRSLLNEWVSE